MKGCPCLPLGSPSRSDQAADGPSPQAPIGDPVGNCEKSPWETRALAFHEAAHAVFAMLGGGHIERATIVAGQDYLGIVRWSRASGRIGTPEADVLTIMAGPVAESLALQAIDPTSTKLRWTMADSFLPVIEAVHRNRPVRCTCTSDDCQALHRLLWRRHHETAAGLRLDYARAGETVLHMLRQKAVWKSVRAVATLLLERGTCGHDEIVEQISPELAGVHLLTLGAGLSSRLTPILCRPAPESTPSPAPAHG